MGSPPLVRERRQYSHSHAMLFGITPARAGKTHAVGHVGQRDEDHPRSCGKDLIKNETLFVLVGSPPLVRERPLYCILDGAACRITPARAGKTPRSSSSVIVIQDHPRSCGKDVCPARRPVAGWGSPPLVRERHADGSCPNKDCRITPARAGKTSRAVPIIFHY